MKLLKTTNGLMKKLLAVIIAAVVVATNGSGHCERSEAISKRDCFGASRLAMTMLAPGSRFEGGGSDIRVTGRDIFHMLQTKYGIRAILKGGPIAQPGFIRAVRRDSQMVEGMKQRYGSDKFWDESYHPGFVNPNDIIDFELVVEGVLNGNIKLPLIYKPNLKAIGIDIFFLEQDADKKIRITMAYNKRHNKEEGFMEDRIKAILQDIMIQRWARVIEDSDQDIIQIVLTSTKRDIVTAVLKRIWEKVSSICGDGCGTYDSGMVEAVMPVVKYKGKAYETRHIFVGNLLSGNCDLHKEGRRKGCSFARIGSSGYFSNQTGRRGPVYELPQSKMFNPLFEMYKIRGKRRKQFVAYTDAKIREEFLYLTGRLKAAGIELDTQVQGEFDIMWLPPSEGSNDFPVPMLIEATILPLDDADIHKKGIHEKEIVISKKFSSEDTIEPAAAGAGFEQCLMQKLPDKLLVIKNQDLLNQLTPQQRLVLKMLFIEDKTTEQIAKNLEITDAGVSCHKQNGLRSLRKLLDPNSDCQLVRRNQDLLAQLPPEDERVLREIFLEGKKRVFIAREMGLRRAVSKVSLYKEHGLQELRRILAGRQFGSATELRRAP